MGGGSTKHWAPSNEQNHGRRKKLFASSCWRKGFKIVYCPGVIVGHRIQADRLDFSTLCRRAYWWGRGKAHIYGGPQQDLLKNHAAGWWLCQCGAIAWTTFKALFRIFLVPREGRVIESVKRITDLGYQIEAMRLARNSR